MLRIIKNNRVKYFLCIKTDLLVCDCRIDKEKKLIYPQHMRCYCTSCFCKTKERGHNFGALTQNVNDVRQIKESLFKFKNIDIVLYTESDYIFDFTSYESMIQKRFLKQKRNAGIAHLLWTYSQTVNPILLSKRKKERKAPESRLMIKRKLVQILE